MSAVFMTSRLLGGEKKKKVSSLNGLCYTGGCSSEGVFHDLLFKLEEPPLLTVTMTSYFLQSK